MIVRWDWGEGLATDTLSVLEEHVRRGEFVQAIREAEQLMMMPDLSPREMGRLFRLSGRARAESGDPYGGLKVLELAIPWALKARDWDCLGMARAELGMSWLSIGDVANAIDCLQAYLLDFPRYGRAASYLGHVHYHLGLAYRRRKDYTNAVSHYRQALEWFTEKGYTTLTGETHQNLAWLYCLEGAGDAAEAELSIADTFAEVCGAEFKVEQLVCRAFLYKIRREIVPALALVNEVLQPGRPACTYTHKAHAAWIAGSVSLAIHSLDHAVFFADLATMYALDAKDTSIMSQASMLKVEIARRKQGSNEAAG